MVHATDFQTGMMVYSADGIPLGRIHEVWADTETHGSVPMSHHLLKNYGPIRGTDDLLATSRGYLQVRRRDCQTSELQDVLIPLAEVQSIVPAESATVKGTAHGYVWHDVTDQHHPIGGQTVAN